MHASAIVAGERGVLVAGPSGSGKTALALALIAHCRQWGVFGALLADDQVLVEPANGRIVMRAPSPIAGLVEVRGFGPAGIFHQRLAVADLVVRLVDPAAAPRMAEEGRETILGVGLPRLDLPAGQIAAGVLAVAAHLSLPPFGPPHGGARARFGRP